MTSGILYLLILAFKKIVYLAALGFSCSTQDLQLWHVNSWLWLVGSSSLTSLKNKIEGLPWWSSG